MTDLEGALVSLNPREYPYALRLFESRAPATSRQQPLTITPFHLEATMLCVEDNSDADSEDLLFDIIDRQQGLFETLIGGSRESLDPMLGMAGSWGGCDDEVDLGGQTWKELSYRRSLSSADLTRLRGITGCTELEWLLRVRQVRDSIVSVHTIGPDETLRDRSGELELIFQALG